MWMLDTPACLADMAAPYRKAVHIVLGGIYHHLRSMVLRLGLNNCEVFYFCSNE